ncbi:HMG1/2-like protein [Hordeum vulgare]|nr:HMG1/2-like protein [Hordeum vulgare]
MEVMEAKERLPKETKGNAKERDQAWDEVQSVLNKEEVEEVDFLQPYLHLLSPSLIELLSPTSTLVPLGTSTTARPRSPPTIHGKTTLITKTTHAFWNSYWILRHGRSLPNERGLIVSSLENDTKPEFGVAPQGVEQARFAGESLQKELEEMGVPVDYVKIRYSPFSRTTETARVVAGVHGIPFVCPSCKIAVKYYFQFTVVMREVVIVCSLKPFHICLYIKYFMEFTVVEKIYRFRLAMKKSKAEKDPNKPKRPPSAFFVFMDTVMKEYREKHPNVKQVFVIIIVHLVIANSYLQTQDKTYLVMQY